MGENATPTPRIYVACLAAYNNGRLHGSWINADQSADEITREIGAMLSRSPVAGAEEHAIHDFEGFGGVRVGEYSSAETVAELAAFIVEHGDLGGMVLDHFGGALEEATEALTERYFGEYQHLADFIEESNSNVFEVPEALRPYIDWKAMAHDAELSGDVFTIETGFQEVHVFSG